MPIYAKTMVALVRAACRHSLRKTYEWVLAIVTVAPQGIRRPCLRLSIKITALNPKAVVPTLAIGDEIVTDTVRIVYRIDRDFDAALASCPSSLKVPKRWGA